MADEIDTFFAEVMAMKKGESQARCMCCQAPSRVRPTTQDCRCLVCEPCALDFMENYACGVCGTFLTLD